MIKKKRMTMTNKKKGLFGKFNMKLGFEGDKFTEIETTDPDELEDVFKLFKKKFK